MLARRGLVVLASALLAGGCFTATPRLDRMAYRLEQNMPGTSFEQEMGLKLGRMSLGLTRTILAAADDDDGERAFAVMKGLRRVEVGSYRVRGERPDLAFGDALEHAFDKNGWLTVARVRDVDERVWVLYKLEAEEIRGFMVVSLSDEDLEIVRLDGRLDRSLAAALRAAQDRS